MPQWASEALFWFFGNLLWDFVLASMVAALLIWLKKKKEAWATPVLYGLVGFAAVFVLAFTLVGRSLISNRGPETTPENIESNIKDWADNLSLGIQREKNDNSYFTFVLSVPPGNRSVYVQRYKETKKYLTFHSEVVIGPDVQEIINKLSPSQRDQIRHEVEVALLTKGISFVLMSGRAALVGVAKPVPITSGLNEDVFASSIDELDKSTLLVREATFLALAHVGVLPPNN
jgi:hypothetical protein